MQDCENMQFHVLFTSYIAGTQNYRQKNLWRKKTTAAFMLQLNCYMHETFYYSLPPPSLTFWEILPLVSNIFPCHAHGGGSHFFTFQHSSSALKLKDSPLSLYCRVCSAAVPPLLPKSVFLHPHFPQSCFSPCSTKTCECCAISQIK